MDRNACIASTACSPSLSGTGSAAGSSWPGIAWVSNPYYALGDTSFAFGSEIKAILEAGLFPGRLRPEGLWHYAKGGEGFRGLIAPVTARSAMASSRVMPNGIAFDTHSPVQKMNTAHDVFPGTVSPSGAGNR